MKNRTREQENARWRAMRAAKPDHFRAMSRASVRKTFARRRRMGLCVRCGDPAEGSSCQPCRDYRNEYDRDRRAKNSS